VRVLGIDPGLTRCGLGVIDGSTRSKPRLIAVDVVRTDAALGLPERLLTLETAIENYIDTHQPQRVAVERVFAQHNVQTVMGTAHAAGVAMLIAARHGLPVAIHTPSEAKAAITGSGRADKSQVTAMVTRILRLAGKPTPADAADALALAICQLWRGSGEQRLSQALRAKNPQGGVW
jgi:crossover junction endodeoxyribonuclease RuvC